MEYPCIVYKKYDVDSRFANNNLYSGTQRYQVTVIDRNPDSEIPAKILRLPMCIYDRFYVANNLNHDVMVLYYGGVSD